MAGQIKKQYFDLKEKRENASNGEKMIKQTAIGLLLPFLGTALGAAMVFFLKDKLSDVIQKTLAGFASGVMMAASFWSLLQPAYDRAHGPSYRTSDHPHPKIHPSSY